MVEENDQNLPEITASPYSAMEERMLQFSSANEENRTEEARADEKLTRKADNVFKKLKVFNRS